MKTQVTLKQVAEAAGVHFSTVSRALNPATRDRVTPDVVARVLEIADKLGYRANGIASSLRTRRSRVVGFVVPDIGSLLFPPILEGIEQTLLEQGYMTIIGNTANDPQRHRNVLAGMIERQVDGLILATATLRDPTVEEWVERRAPLVLINRTDTSGRAPAVINDDVRGTGLAVAHLAGLGHRRIGHIAGPQHISTGLQRLRGFEAGMAERNIAVKPARAVIATSFRRDAGRTACEQLLDNNSDLTAIVAANDLLALGCYDALNARGLNCPRDMSVTGYNDTPLADVVMPPLTTIRISQRDMGIEAARLLLKRMEQIENAPADVLMRPELVIRQSTAAPRAA